jgi:TonB dependent receptor
MVQQETNCQLPVLSESGLLRLIAGPLATGPPVPAMLSRKCGEFLAGLPGFCCWSCSPRPTGRWRWRSVPSRKPCTACANRCLCMRSSPRCHATMRWHSLEQVFALPRMGTHAALAAIAHQRTGPSALLQSDRSERGRDHGRPDRFFHLGFGCLDHDQRNTLNIGADVSRPWRSYASTNIYYGSGFNAFQDQPYPGGYLPGHTTFDLSLGKDFGERVSASLNALNVANRGSNSTQHHLRGLPLE